MVRFSHYAEPGTGRVHMRNEKWPIPEIMRVICCGQIFSICRAWTRTSSHEEWVAGYLRRKGHSHTMPKNLSALIGAVCNQYLKLWEWSVVVRFLAYSENGWRRVRMMNVYLAIKGEKCMDTECLKNIFPLIRSSVWPINEIMRVIYCGQIFSKCRAWTRTSLHNEQVHCCLVEKGKVTECLKTFLH